MTIKKHKAIFTNQGGTYLVTVQAREEGTDEQNKWGKYFDYLGGGTVYDYEATAIANDMKKDGFIIEWK